ncbi:MAG: hypothetical protein V3573_10390 [Desulfovibrionaceae bacterium]
MKPTNIDSGKVTKIEVDEADKRKVFGKKPAEPAVRSAGKSVFLIGLLGSGRRAVGRTLAARLKLGFIEISDRTGLDQALSGERVVASVDQGLVADEEAAALLRNKGVVFYLMPGVQAVAEARGLVADEECKRRIFAEIDEWETRFMRVLHFLLPGGISVEATAADAADKLYMVK